MRILAAFALVIAGIAGIVMAQRAQTNKKDSQPGKVAEQAKTPRLSPEDPASAHITSAFPASPAQL